MDDEQELINLIHETIEDLNALLDRAAEYSIEVKLEVGEYKKFINLTPTIYIIDRYRKAIKPD